MYIDQTDVFPKNNMKPYNLIGMVFFGCMTILSIKSSLFQDEISEFLGMIFGFFICLVFFLLYFIKDRIERKLALNISLSDQYISIKPYVGILKKIPLDEVQALEKIQNSYFLTRTAQLTGDVSNRGYAIKLVNGTIYYVGPNMDYLKELKVKIEKVIENNKKSKSNM